MQELTRTMWIVDSHDDVSSVARILPAMTRRRRPGPTLRPATVYGEHLDELLPAMAAICTGGEIVPADTDPRFDQDMLSLSLSLPHSAGGSVRRALLRSQAEILRRQADSVGMCAPPAACLHSREAAAMLAVAERLQRVARAAGISGKTLGERALLLGRFSAPPPCRCRGIC